MRNLEKRVFELEMVRVDCGDEMVIDRSAMTATQRTKFDHAARRYHQVGPREMEDHELRAIFNAPRVVMERAG